MKLSAKDRTKLFERLMDRAEGCCEYCHGSEKIDGLQAPLDAPHHIKFRSQGGVDTIENMILLCRFCHWRAHSIIQPKIDRDELFQIIGVGGWDE